MYTKDQIIHDASLCAVHGGREDCPFKEGTAGYVLWMEAYREANKRFYDDVDESYEMSLEA